MPQSKRNISKMEHKGNYKGRVVFPEVKVSARETLAINCVMR